MPPISGIAGIAGFSSFISLTVASVVISRLATLTAFCSAIRSTFTGSIMPAENISTSLPFAASKPSFSLAFSTSFATTPASKPAFSAIWRSGAKSARLTISAPIASSPLRPRFTFLLALIIAAPPPITIPSSTAAFVAFSASSTLSLRSFISVSVAAPTFITATPPLSFARRSCSFSLSYSLVVSAICVLI